MNSRGEMFKKSNRNFRSKRADFDSDDEEKKPPQTATTETSLPVAKTTTAAPYESSKQPTLTKKVLHFNDAEEQDEFNEENGADSTTEFKVKKSKESRRISKEIKKIKKEKEKQTSSSVKPTTATVKVEPDEAPVTFNQEIKFKPLNVPSNAKKASKYISNRYKTDGTNTSEDEDEFKNASKSIDETESRNDEAQDDDDKLRVGIFDLLLH
jgi:hypothetical protein